MIAITPYQACYYAHELTRLGAVGELDRLSTTLFDSKVDLNPHQVDAALFAISNPLQTGVILADEVGLGKTIEAGLVLCQKWAERKRKLIVVAPAHIRKQWQTELSEKFNLPAMVLDRRVWSMMRKEGHPNPFDCGKIIVISYGFASRMKDDLRAVAFDLVVLDEAHKLRNAYAMSATCLQQDGVIFASIDDTEAPLLRRTADEVLGPDNRVGTIVWKGATDNNPTKIAIEHEYLACYAKAKSELPEQWSASSSDVKELMLSEFDKLKSSCKSIEELQKAFGEFVETRREQLGDLYRYRRIDSVGPFAARRNMDNPGKPGPRYDVLHPVTNKPCTVPEWGWRFTEQKMNDLISAGRIIFGEDEKKIPELKVYLKDVRFPLRSVLSMDARKGSNTLDRLFGSRDIFRNPKPFELLQMIFQLCTSERAWILDYFAGSGTTGHAVINLNREDGGARRFILIEMGAHFDTVLKSRIVKTLYSPEWKDGIAESHVKGVSALVKYFSLESYEDALNNLPLPAGSLLAGLDAATKDALITYTLDLEMGPSLLNLEVFRDPWGYRINAQPTGDAEIRSHGVDLVETFNYLLGLRVKAYGPLERYAAEFEQAKHVDGLGRTKIKGRLRRESNGPFVFQRVEGELNDSQGTRVLVVWRKLTDNPDHDAAALEAWMNRYREDTRERSEHRDYQQIYVNGPVTLPQPTAEIRTVYPIEQTFKDRMFADTDEGLHG